ncbi:LOW QUALITY PROTEIN: protein NPG1-like [Gossypium hirsutum]|uniref:LOW QUALITY PROTEIN: protein NPG1-like n=1 Tax=Gossypium hirsutum TaxID=3635 RepID=A0ABM2ZB85_GOSHI|nr:LOW QUALITY PROTEIN: protein NPG1-like [Gossypium hirsutum]
MADDETPSQTQESSTAREFSANGTSMSTTDVEAKLDKGNIEEAESSLRERLSLNSEEARTLLGRLEYQRGNVEAALRVLDGIDLQAAIQKLQPSVEHLNPNSSSVSSSNYSSSHENSCANLDSQSQQAARLVLEGVYLKVKSLQKLGKFAEAAQDCTNILDAVGRIFPQGIPDAQVESKLQEMISKAVELLPELLKQAGKYQEAMAAYRRVLLNPWNLDNDCCGRIQKAFAVFLLHSGLEAGPPSLGAQADGAYVPKNNLEEAILLLLVLMRKIHHGDIQWDPSVLDHLMYALSLCSQTPVLSKQLEELKPGVFHRTERWNLLALCCSGVGQNKAAMNLLRKSLHINERPNDLTALLLAAKICSEDSQLAAEGVGYAQRAVDNAKGVDEHLKGVGLRMLGLCLGKQAKVSSSDFERSRLQNEALKSLDSALSFEQDNPDIIFELGAHYAEQRNLNAALRFAKKYIDITGGSVMKGWRLLALILSAQQRFAEAEVVIDAALDETGKWEQGPLLRLKAKLKVSQSRPMEAIETYRYLLALVQAQRKSFGPMKIDSQVEDDKVKEFEVWYGLAALYSSLSHWKDVEVCVKKAREMKQYSAELVHTEGFMHQERGEIQEALASYINASLLDPFYVPSKVWIGALLSKLGSNSLPVARTLLSDALRIEPTNRKAWYHLGMVHKDDGRLADAIDCLQAASMLEESDPVENFRSIL